MDNPSRGRWSSPATPLQAARFEHRWLGKDVVDRLRAVCPGHVYRKHLNPCRFDESKLSEYENGKNGPGLIHIEALCRVYQKSPEDLGLITWRDTTTTTAAASTTTITELPSADYSAILIAAVADGPADEQLIDLLSEAISLSSAAAVACRELRAALQQRAALTLA